MARSPTRIDFHRTKYGREILIDVAWIREMPTFLHEEPHWLSFYDITLITAGRGDFWLDGQRHAVRPGAVLFTSPGQVRRWRVQSLEGICLFFPSTFLEEFFNDAQFLHRLPYFHVPADAAAITLAPAGRRALLRRWERMHEELRHWSRDSAHALRASLYDELIRVSREYARAHGTDEARTPHAMVLRLRELVDVRAPHAHDLTEYTRALGVSPQHLTRLCRRHLGCSAKDVIEARLEILARRALLFTEQSVQQVGTRLGFGDPSYFARFFRRRTGMTPSAFRRAAGNPHLVDVVQ
jgi:AraC family transcriptional regulator, transcriptional activator of pobA